MKTKIFLMAMILVLLVGCTPKGISLSEDFLTEAHEAVKKAYGDVYIPSMPIDEMYLEGIYGIDLDLVEEFIAEGPMMSVNVDTFVGIKAKKGEVSKIENSLNAYRDYLINESLQYPMNMAKVNASKVYVIEDYVFFLMLGDFFDAAEPTEEEALEFAEKQVNIAVSAIEGIVK